MKAPLQRPGIDPAAETEPPRPAGDSVPGSPRATRRSRRVYDVVRTLHTYVGLLNFTHFLVFGIAGLVATFTEHREPPSTGVRFQAFAVPASGSDKEVADAVYAAVAPSLAGPVPEWAIRRDEAGNLLLNFYSVNGIQRVTVLEEEGRLRIERLRNSLGRYLSNLHATTVRERSGDWRLALWAGYIEFALWSLIAMSLSGLYLWLYARPRYRPAAYTCLGGIAVFVLLYVLTR